MTAIPTWNKCVYTLMRVHAHTHRLTHSTLLTVSLPFKSWTPVQLPVSSLQGQKFPARSPLSWKPASPFVSSPDCCPQPSLSDSGPHHSSLLSTHSSRLPPSLVGLPSCQEEIKETAVCLFSNTSPPLLTFASSFRLVC